MRWLLVMLGCLMALPAFAATAVQLAVDVDQLAQGERTGFSVVVTGGRPQGIPDVQASPGLAIVFAGQQQTTSIVNGRMERYVRFRFDVAAQQEGSWTLGPAKVAVLEGAGAQSTVTSNSVTLTVGPAVQGRGGGAIEVETGFDTVTAWQGELVVYRYLLRTRRELANAQWHGQPDEGLMIPKEGRADTREYVVEDATGPVLVQEVWQPFVVTGSGRLDFPAPTLDAAVVESDAGPRGLLGMFRRTRREIVMGSAMTLDVRPLPPPPPGFSGLVGDFTLRSQLDTSRTKAGKSVRWIVGLDGDGSLEGFELPPPSEVDGLRFYQGSTRGRGSMRRDAYASGLTIDRTVVPTREGRVSVPPVELIVFSPTKGDYVTLTAPAIPLTVDPGEVSDIDLQSFGQDPTEQPVLDDDAPEGVRAMWSTGPSMRLPWVAWMPLAMALAGLPALGLGLMLGAERGRAWWTELRADPEREATPLERLAHLPEDPAARLAALDDCLRLALARVGHVPVHRLDREVVVAGLEPELAARVRMVTGALDRARFAHQAHGPDLEAEVAAVVGALGRVEAA